MLPLSTSLDNAAQVAKLGMERTPTTTAVKRKITKDSQDDAGSSLGTSKSSSSSRDGNGSFGQDLKDLMKEVFLRRSFSQDKGL